MWSCVHAYKLQFDSVMRELESNPGVMSVAAWRESHHRKYVRGTRSRDQATHKALNPKPFPAMWTHISARRAPKETLNLDLDMLFWEYLKGGQRPFPQGQQHRGVASRGVSRGRFHQTVGLSGASPRV